MNGRRAEKRPMEPPISDGERRREREQREKAKKEQRARNGGRSERSYEPEGREGEWGPPPPWWIQQQERRKKKKEMARRRELERKPADLPRYGGGHGDPLAKKARASSDPLVVSLPPGAKGTVGEPIPVEDGSEAMEVECFKCGRLGHF